MGTEHLTKLAGTSLEKALARPFSQETLVSWFKSTLESRRCTRIEAIRASKLNSTFSYQIIAGSRHASRDKLLQLAFGLELTPEETSRMLTLGGHAPPHGGRPPRHHRGVVPRKRSRARGGGRHPLEPRREHGGRPLTRARAYVLGGGGPGSAGAAPRFLTCFEERERAAAPVFRDGRLSATDMGAGGAYLSTWPILPAAAILAWAAVRRAMGTRYGEQDT